MIYTLYTNHSILARFRAIASSTALSSRKSSSRRELFDIWPCLESAGSGWSRGCGLIGTFSGVVRLVVGALSADRFKGLFGSTRFFDESSEGRLLEGASTGLGVRTLSAARLIGLEDVTSSRGLECRWGASGSTCRP